MLNVVEVLLIRGTRQQIFPPGEKDSFWTTRKSFCRATSYCAGSVLDPVLVRLPANLGKVKLKCKNVCYNAQKSLVRGIACFSEVDTMPATFAVLSVGFRVQMELVGIKLVPFDFVRNVR